MYYCFEARGFQARECLLQSIVPLWISTTLFFFFFLKRFYGYVLKKAESRAVPDHGAESRSESIYIVVSSSFAFGFSKS